MTELRSEPDPGKPVSRWRRWVVIAGVLLIAGGLGLLGYVGWEYWGTNVISRHRQHEGVQALQRAWAGGHSEATTDWGTANALIRIPRFGSSYEVPVYEGVGDSVLAAGFGHFPGTAGPGEVGNYALAGHRVTHGEPLRGMPDLRVGDEVDVVTRKRTYVYRLVTAGPDLVVPFTAGWVVDPLPDNPETGGVEPPQKKGQRLITLTTCSELFHTDNRMVAFGVLEATRASRTS